MPKKHQHPAEFPTDNRGRLIDPFTGDPLIPLKELEEARGQIQPADREMQNLLERGWQLQSKVISETQINQARLVSNTRKILPDKDYLPNGFSPTNVEREKVFKGSQLCWRHPHNHRIILLSPIYIDAIAQLPIQKDQQNANKALFQQLRAQGYKTYAEAEQITGLSQKNLSYRANRLKADENYLSNGLPPSQSYTGQLLKGSQISWVNPSSRLNRLLHPEFVEGLRQAEEKYKQLLAVGYLDSSAAEEKHGVDRQQLEYHGKKLEPDKQYNLNGLPYDSTQHVNAKSGKDLKWTHPYDGHVVYHPDFVRACAEEAKNEKTLRAEGYQAVYEVAKELGLKDYIVRSAAASIDLSQDYLPDGRLPTGLSDETTVKGNTLRWDNPYSDEILISPTFIQGLKERQGLTDQWIRMSEAAKLLGVKHTFIVSRLKQIDPSQNYLKNGLSPTGAVGEEVVKGSDFTKRFSSTVTCIRRSLADGWKKAEDQYKELVAEGYQTPQQTRVATGLGVNGVSSWIGRYDPAAEYTTKGTRPSGSVGEKIVPGSRLVWRHPYSSTSILIHPDLVTARAEAESAAQVLVGNGGEGVVSAELTETALANKGYKTMKEVCETANITHTAVSWRLRRYQPDKYYDKKGITEVPEGDGAIKGSDFHWTHPFNAKIKLIHPELVAAWTEANQQFLDLQSQGYMRPDEAASYSGLAKGTIVQRISKIDLDKHYTRTGILLEKAYQDSVKGKDLYWRHPYSGDLLLTRNLVEGWKSVYIPQKHVQKTSPATKIGDADESKLPGNVRGQLDQKRKTQREK